MKIYSLEEMYIMSNGKFWKVIIESSDIKKLRKLKDLYQSKDKLGIYRIMELKK